MGSVQVPPLMRRSRSVSTEVAAHLERLIISGELKPGDRLPPERELAESAGVSRGSLREAMSELEHKKLIERHQGRGSVVADTPKAVKEMTKTFAGLDGELANASELRNLVEPRIAQLAALRAADSNLLSLEEILLRSNENLSSDESLRTDVEFHLALAHAAQNPLLVALCSMTSSWTEESRRLSHQTLRGRRLSVEGHKRIYEALVRRDESAASLAMELHLREVAALISSQSQKHSRL